MESPKVFRQCLNLRRVLWVLLMVCTLMPSGHAQLGKKADLSNLVVIGDSTSAGVQNGSLLETQQENGYASLVAGQAGVPLRPLPLIAFPGIPNVITNVSVGPPVSRPEFHRSLCRRSRRTTLWSSPKLAIRPLPWDRSPRRRYSRCGRYWEGTLGKQRRQAVTGGRVTSQKRERVPAHSMNSPLISGSLATHH